jgi:hypothetical protein
MAGLDAFRMAMTGGNRYIDYGNTGVASTRYMTVLERANLTGQTAFTTKNMTSSDADRRLNLATPLLGETGNGNIVVFTVCLPAVAGLDGVSGRISVALAK